MLHFLCCHLLIQEGSAEKLAGEASEAWLQLIITLESLPAASRPAHLKCNSTVCTSAALRSARASAGAGYIGAFIQYVEGTGPAREAPSLE